MAKSVFQVQVNGSPEHTIEVVTGLYHLAALAALALVEYEPHPEYDVVKIWVPRLVEAGYGPYFYGWDEHAQRLGTPDADRKW